MTLPSSPPTPAEIALSARTDQASPPASSTSAAPGDVLRSTSETALPAVRRLLVLIPETDLYEAELARQVWMLAAPRGLPVLFLGVSQTAEVAFRTRRRLIILAALTCDDRVAVETHLEFASDWVRAVRARYRPGDLVICHAEQRVSRWGLRRSLDRVITFELQAPVLALSGFYMEEPAAALQPVAGVASWIVVFAIGLGFLWLQFQIIQGTENLLETVLLGLSVLIEYGLMALWLRFSSENL